MSHKERLLAAVNHEEPDRVPLCAWYTPEGAASSPWGRPIIPTEMISVLLGSMQFALLAAGMAALYRYVPNTFVRREHAWGGALFASLGLEIAQKVLAFYLGKVPVYATIYGAFAAVPIGINYLFERRSLRFFAINAGYDLVGLMLAGAAMAMWFVPLTTVLDAHGLHAIKPLAFATTGMLVNTAYFPANAATNLPSRAEIVSSVTSYINEWTPERDPLVTVPGVGEVKASNLHGVEVAGQRYYYRVLGGASFDPLSAGQAGRYETVAVLDQGTPWEVQIYQIAK